MQRINSQHINSYFQCYKKSFLISNGNDNYRLTDYEAMVFKAKEIAEKKYFQNNITQLYSKDSLKNGITSIYDARLNVEHFDFECKLLLKNEGMSSLGNFYYEPGLFIGTNKVSKENRMELAFLGFILEKIQKKFPDNAFVINKNGEKTRFKINKLKKI